MAPDATLTRIDAELESNGYRTHEFGDSVFLERRRGRRAGRRTPDAGQGQGSGIRDREWGSGIPDSALGAGRTTLNPEP